MYATNVFDNLNDAIKEFKRLLNLEKNKTCWMTVYYNLSIKRRGNDIDNIIKLLERDYSDNNYLYMLYIWNYENKTYTDIQIVDSL